MREFLTGCREALGPAHVLVDPDVTAGYATDWTGRFRGAAPAVVRPGSTAEVAEVVALARRHRVALVPQGGNTGLVGGGVPLAGEVVVSLGRLDRLEVDGTAAQATAGAGVPLAALRAAAAAAGLAFGVDLGARDSATVGGMVATNAGGIHVLRHGAMRAQVVGVEAVLGTGAVVSRLAGLVKDNTGYDLAQLLCGSEGTLGIVTAARLRLVAPPGQVVTALVGDRLRGRGGGGRLGPAPRRGGAGGPGADGRAEPAAGGGPPGGSAPGRPRRRGLPAGGGGRARATRCRRWPRPSTAGPACSTRPWPPSGPSGRGCGAGGRPTPRWGPRWARSTSWT